MDEFPIERICYTQLNLIQLFQFKSYLVIFMHVPMESNIYYFLPYDH